MDKEKWRHLYPFTSHYITLGETKLHYLDEGDGEVLLMVHGNPTWSFFFRRLIQHLSQNYRVVVPDHVGCGLSDKPGNYSYTLSTHISNLKCLINELRLKNITLILHDWGGPISLGYAVKHPDNINNIVILNSSAFWLPRFNLGIRILNKRIIGKFLIQGIGFFNWVGVVLGPKRRLSKEEKKGYLAPYSTYKNRIAVWNFVQDIPISRSHPSYPALKFIDDHLFLLSSKSMLIVWGLKDPVFDKKFLLEWKRRFPNAQVSTLKNAGHYLLEDEPDQIRTLITNFLEAQEHTKSGNQTT